MHLNHKIRPQKVGLILAGIAVVLALLSLITEYQVEVVHQESESILIPILDLFSVNLEGSIPTWYSTILLFVACLLLAIITRAKWHSQDSYRGYWLGLTLVFLYLSMDEGASIHEIAADPLTLTFNTSGYLFFGWQILALPIVMIFALLYLRFLLNLPRITALGFIIAGLIYIGGAVVVEGLSANQYFLEDSDFTYTYLSIATLEELLEMLGVVTLIHVLLHYGVMQGLNVTFYSREDALITRPKEVEISKPTEHETNLSLYVDKMRQSRVIALTVTTMLGMSLTFYSWLGIIEMGNVTFPSVLIIELIGILSAFIVVAYMIRNRLLILRPLWMGVAWLALQLGMIFGLRLFVMGVNDVVTASIIGLLVPIILIILVGGYVIPTLSQSTHNIKPLYIALLFGLIIGGLSIFAFDGLDSTLIVIFGGVTTLAALALWQMSGVGFLRLAIIAGGLLWFFPALNGWNNTQIFVQAYDLPDGMTTLVTDYSLQQKIDVLEDRDGLRYLLLNNTPHFDPRTQALDDAILGPVPTSIIRPENALVLYANALQLESRLANFAEHITTIEPDPTVVAISQQYIADVTQPDRLTNQIVIDNLPLWSTELGSFDFITIDLSSTAIHAQPIYSSAFFEHVADHLTDEGVLALNLGGEFVPDNLRTRQIVATLLETYDEVMVVTLSSGKKSFAYASHDLPFTREQIQRTMEAFGLTGLGIFETDAVRAIVGSASPIPSP